MTDVQHKYRLLVVDDEIYICNIVTEALSAVDAYEVISFSDPQQGLEYIEKNRVDLILTDLIMGEYSGVNLLDQALRCHPDCIVILMTAYPTVNNAISVLKKGAYDYLVKPFKLETLKSAVVRGLEHQALARDNLRLKEQLALYKLSEDMGEATTLDETLGLAATTARSIIGGGPVSILVRDKSGTIPVPYLIKGTSTLPEIEDFLRGNHELCHQALSSHEPRHQSRESGGKRSKIVSLACLPMVWRGEVIGLLNIVREDKFLPIKTAQLNLLSIIAAKVASVIENNRLYEHLQNSYVKAIKALANSIEARDKYTRGHTDRVTVLADLIAVRLGWSERKRAEMKIGCTLHDIGKIGVPDSILNKPSYLTDAERHQMETHPVLGAKILEGIDYLKPAIPYILYHHEKYDGSGYPHGLAGENIPIEGRLLAVVDTYDAIVSDRPYRDGADAASAIEEIIKFKDIQFDPMIVDVLVDVWKDGLIDRLGIYPGGNRPEGAEPIEADFGLKTADIKITMTR